LTTRPQPTAAPNHDPLQTLNFYPVTMLAKSELTTLLPHQGSMFLLDQVLRFDRDEIECNANSHRDPHNPLRHQGVLPAHVAIEYAAQAAGIHGGLLNRQQYPDAPAQMGYLAVISNLHWSVQRLDDLPDVLHIHARRTAVTPGGRAYRVRIQHQGAAIMSGDLIIALQTSGRDVV
jgi:predicted hotdog family 3-hydroxylacyl-ACP dehydratase